MGENLAMVQYFNWYFTNLSTLFTQFQFAQGALMPSSDLLRMVEEIAAEDEAKLQRGFDAYDGCSGKSN